MNKKTFSDAERKMRKLSTLICDTLELVVAVIVVIGVVIAIISLFPEISHLWEKNGEAQEFIHFLEQVFTVVIGIEFLKMLCRPNSDNVFETIIFLVARHMIINTTTPLEDLLSTVSIVLLCLVRRYLKETRNTGERENTLFNRMRGGKHESTAAGGTAEDNAGGTEDTERSQGSGC